MSGSSFKNILVPTLLTSSVAFYATTAAFTLFASRPIVEPSPLPSNRLQYALSKEYKELTIRNVGLCILVSVATGLGVAEIARRKNASSKGTLSKQSHRSQSASELSQLQPDALEIFPVKPEFVKHSSAMETSDLGTDDAEAPIDDMTMSEGVSRFSIAETNEPYHTCRIKVPHLQQSLFAILLDGQYYSFIKAEKKREKALDIGTILHEKGDRTIVTHTSNRYVVWSWQPQAEPCA